MRFDTVPATALLYELVRYLQHHLKIHKKRRIFLPHIISFRGRRKQSQVEEKVEASKTRGHLFIKRFQNTPSMRLSIQMQKRRTATTLESKASTTSTIFTLLFIIVATTSSFFSLSNDATCVVVAAFSSSNLHHRPSKPITTRRKHGYNPTIDTMRQRSPTNNDMNKI